MFDTPKSIGPYRILAVLGQGGMGIVYRAQHRLTGSLAAVKTVSFPNEDVVRCLRREIRALARISHPGVVRILDDGVEGGIPWYAMELVDGVTLRQDYRHWAIDQTVRKTESEPTEPPEVTLERAVTADVPSRRRAVGETMVGHSPAFRASDPNIVVPPAAPVAEVRPVVDVQKLTATLSLVRRLCWSLAFVHGEGIVHRDLKPENVLVRQDGSPVLMDFGLAVHLKRERSRDHLGLSAGVSGTVYYMAPEQLRGQFVDARADLYSLGCILYELVTGRPPFVGDQPVQVAYQHFRTPPVPPSERVEGLPVDLDHLILRLLEKDPPQRFGHADDVAAALQRLGANGSSAQAKERPKAYLYRPGMAGRAVILQQLKEHLDRLEEEQGDVVLIGGESGVGKTRLVLEVAREASNRKMRILTAECLPTSANDTEASGGLALHPFQQALRVVADRCREQGLEETERLLGRRGKVLARFEPMLIGLAGQDAYPQPAELPPAAAQLRLYSHLAATLSALAEDRPLLFVLDDLQWADDLTLGFLQFLLRGNQIHRMKLLVVATYRSEAVAANSRSSLSSLLEAARDHRVELGRLGGDSVASMVGDMLAVTPPPTRLVAFLARQSEGNPFFVAEYLKTAVAQDLLYRDEHGRWHVGSGPAAATIPETEEAYEELPLPNSVRKLVSRRLRGLPPATRALIEAAAVVGREVSAILVWRMLRLDVPEILDATHDALRRQILEEVQSGAALRFVHDKIREVAYEELAPPQRAALHQLAAEGIEGFSIQAVEGDFGALAFHWEQAGEKQRARGLYLKAARTARSLYSHVEAERLYRAFQRLVTAPDHDSIEVRNELAREVLSLRGDNAAAIEEHLLALGEARLIQDRLGEARSLQGLSTTHRLSGRVREAREYGEQALAIYRELGDRPAEGTALMVLAAAYLALGQLQRAQELFESALVIDREVGNSVHEAVTLSNLAVIAREQGNDDEAKSLQTQALEIHRRVSNRRSEGITLENLGTLALDGGNLTDARRFFDASLAIHREVGDRLYEPLPLNGLALLSLQEGSAEEAQALWRQALANAREVDSKLSETQILRTGAAVHRLGLADLDEAQSLVDQSEALARELGNPLEIVASLCERGHLELARGHFAAQVLREAEGLAAETDAGPESRSAGTIAKLRRAEIAFEAGKRIWRGTAPEDLPSGLRERLESESSRQSE